MDLVARRQVPEGGGEGAGCDEAGEKAGGEGGDNVVRKGIEYCLHRQML